MRSSLFCAVLLFMTTRVSATPDLTPLLTTSLPVATQLPVAPVHAIFHIAKSENKNQVHYGARVDEACRPLGNQPIYAYWRMRELGPTQTEGLLDREQPAYGIRAQQVLRRSPRGGRIRLQLRAWPDRPLEIEVLPSRTGCAARAYSEIQHQPAVLQSIYIQLGFLFSVRYAEVRGVSIADGRALTERLRK
jgi:hypothetical protein